MKKEVAILMVISLIIGFLIGYGYMSIRINKMETTIEELEEDLEKAQETLREKVLDKVLLEECLKGAYDVYIKGWNKSCEILGKEKDCALPTSEAEHWNKIHREYRDDCFKKYPQD